MPIRPGWFEDYWRHMDKKTAAKIRTSCPRCGSAKTYFNEQYGTWRCGRFSGGGRERASPGDPQLGSD